MSERGVTLTAGSVKRIARVCDQVEREGATLEAAGMGEPRRRGVTKGVMLVTLYKSDGDQATGSSDCTWVYDIYPYAATGPAGTPLAEDVAPLRPRMHNMVYEEATAGLAQWAGGVLVLCEAYERLAVDTDCAAGA